MSSIMEDQLGGVKRQAGRLGRRLAGDQKPGLAETTVTAANRRRLAVDGSVNATTCRSAARHIGFDAVENWFTIGAASLPSSTSPASGWTVWATKSCLR